MKKTIVTLSVVVFLGLGLMSLTTTKTAYKKVEKSTVLQDANAGKAVYTKVCAACHQPTGTGDTRGTALLARLRRIGGNRKSTQSSDSC